LSLSTWRYLGKTLAYTDRECASRRGPLHFHFPGFYYTPIMKINTPLFLQVLYCKRLTLLGFIFDREARCFSTAHPLPTSPSGGNTLNGTPGRRAFDRGIQPPPSPRLTLPPRAASPRALRHRHCPTATRKHPYSPGPSPPGLRDAHSLQHRSHHGHRWPSRAAMQQSLQTTTR